MITNYNRLCAVLFILLLASCSLSTDKLDFRRGEKASKAQKFSEAVTHYRKVVTRNPESVLALSAARTSARISLYELKDFKSAIYFYEHVVRFSHDEKERRESQEKVANIYYENIGDFKKAIEEFNKILVLRNSNIEQARLYFKIAKAHFNLNEFQEAQNELESALKSVEDDNMKFEMSLFLGNIFFNTKKADKAAEIYEEMIQKYPDKAAEQKVVLNTVACYEELENFDKAIEKLKSIRESYGDPEFIDLKIQRLKERKSNLPGSRGLRK